MDDDIKLTNLPEEEKKKKDSGEDLKDVRGGISSEPVYTTTDLTATVMDTTLISKTLTTPTLNPNLMPLAGK